MSDGMAFEEAPLTHNRLSMETWRSPAGERISSFTIITTKQHAPSEH
jgi:hypothetical protein